jgi:hypothetical protein
MKCLRRIGKKRMGLVLLGVILVGAFFTPTQV